MGRVSRRSEIPSKGDGLAVGGDTSCLGGMGVATHCLVLAFLVGTFWGLPALLAQASYSWPSDSCLSLEPS
jgi:hypothetical protein